MSSNIFIFLSPRESIIEYYCSICDISENSLKDTLFLNFINEQITLNNYLSCSPYTYPIWALTI